MALFLLVALRNEPKMNYLPSILKKLSPLKLRAFIGEKYRTQQRGKGQLLTKSAEVLASALRISLNTNGYENDLETVDDFEILILCTSKDFYILEKNLSHIISMNLIQCKRINVLVDKDEETLNKIIQRNGWKEIEVTNESIFSTEIKFLQDDINQFNPSRRSWILQQCLKTIFVAKSRMPVLIIDSDTLIKKKINLIGNGVQILYAGNDFHYPYSRHLKRFLDQDPIGLSFVHHVQLQKPQIVREIYGQDFLQGISRWLKSGLALAEFSPVSEFQTYGDFILRNYPEKVKLNFHTHHLVDARIFDIELKQGHSRTLESHLMNCECDFVTLENKHLV